MKGDESKKGQERGARRGPGGESIGGHLGLPRQAPAEPHRQIPSPNPPGCTASSCLPGLLLGRCF